MDHTKLDACGCATNVAKCAAFDNVTALAFASTTYIYMYIYIWVVRLWQGLLQEVVEARASAVTLSKAAHLATLVARPHASDLVWSIFSRPRV